MPFTGMFNIASKADLGIDYYPEVLEGSLGLDGAITYQVNRAKLCGCRPSLSYSPNELVSVS